MSLVVLCSVVLLLLSVSGCESGSDQSSSEYISRAQSYLDKGEYKAALIELKNALQKDPDNTQARFLTGQLYLTLGDGATAEKELRRASELGMGEETIQTPMARAYLMQGNFQAVSDLEPSSGLTPVARGELLALRGTAMLNQEKLEEAEAAFEQALAADSNSVEAMVGKARLALVRSDLELTRQLLQQVFSIDEHDADAWSLLGALEQYEGNFEAAEQAYTTASENRIANTGDILDRVIIRIALEKYEEAGADIRQLKNRVGENPGIVYTEGLLNFAQQRYPEAQSAFEKILVLDSENIPALFYVGASHFMQEHMEQATSYLSQFLALRPDYAPAQKMLAWIKLQNGDFSAAQRLIQPVVDQNAEDVFALNLLASALMQQTRTVEGVDYFKQVVALQPDSASARLNLGMGMVMSGDTDSAINALEKAEELYPESEVATIKIIQIHLANKSYDKALQAALSYRENHPKSITAHILLGTAYLSKGDIANAGKIFEAALVIDPGNISANSGLAAIALRSGKLDKAKEYYRDALEKHPGTLATLMNLATIEGVQGNLDAMHEALGQAITANPEALAPLLLLSSQYSRAGQHRKIIELLSPLRTTNADNPTVRGLLGESELAVGDYNKSVDDLSRFVELAPNNVEGHYALARAYAGAGDRSGFYQQLNKVLELDENHLKARSDLAKLMLLEKNFEEARKHIDILKAQTEDQPGALLLEGSLARLTGDTKKAVDAYQQAFEKQRNNINLLLLEEVLWKAGNRDDAVKQLEAWVQEYTEDNLTLTQLAIRYQALGQEKKAIAAYTRVSELAPDNIVVLNNLAWLYLDRDNDRALEYAERAYSLAPQSPEVMDTIAIVVHKRDTRRANKLIDKALDKKPDNPTFLFHKALILQEAGKTAQALQIVQSLVEQNRQFPEKEEARQLLKDMGGV